MRVREVMTADPVRVTPRTAVSEARRLMSSHHIRHLPVVDGDVVVGMVSKRNVEVADERLAASLWALESDLFIGQYRPVETVMSTPARTIGPDDSLSAAAATLIQERIGALPVVEEGRLIGIVSTTDCLRQLVDEAPPQDHTRRPHPPAVPPSAEAETKGATSRPVAFVINPDVSERRRLREELAAEGYRVETCPGPCSTTLCPAREGADAPPCTRLPRRIDLLVVDQGSARTRLLEAYQAWRPGVPIMLADEPTAG